MIEHAARPTVPLVGMELVQRRNAPGASDNFAQRLYKLGWTVSDGETKRAAATRAARFNKAAFHWLEISPSRAINQS